jgi:APA family basic amino acid/polyamine antiporter
MRTKSVEQSIRDTEEPEFQLRKALGPLDLTVFGIGVIIGTGLFVLTGKAAANFAGPAVALSFVFSGIACALAALCYAEFPPYLLGGRDTSAKFSRASSE